MIKTCRQSSFNFIRSLFLPLKLTASIYCYLFRNFSVMSRHCSNKVDLFCYICAQYTPAKMSISINSSIRQRYNNYFKPEKLGDQDKAWDPHNICSTCSKILLDWSTGKQRGFKFAFPAVWHEQSNHLNDCFFVW